MNMKKIFKYILLSALTMAAVASCADDRNNYLPEDSFGFNNKAGENIITLPIYGGSYDLHVIKSGKGLNEGTVMVEAAADTVLAAYNAANETSYVAFPSDQELYSLSSPSMSFKKEDVTLPLGITWDVAKMSDYMDQNPNKEFCIAVSLNSDNLEVNEGRGLYLIHIVKSTLNAVQTNISRTIIWETEPVKEEFSISLQLDNEISTFDLAVGFEVNNELIEQYNSENGTAYEQAPEGLVVFADSAVIVAGTKETSLTITMDTKALVDPATGTVKRDWDGYVVPVRISGISADGVLLDNTLTYIVIKGMKPLAKQAFDRIWGYYSDDSLNLPWFLNSGLSIDGLVGSSFKGDDRNFTMNDKYIFIAKSSATPAIYKFDIMTGGFAGELDVTGMAGSGATYPASCPRMAPNSDPAINNGEDILTVPGLALDGANLTIYAYVNGIDAAPEKMYSLGAARRFGDKVSFSGTWQQGMFWYRSNQSGDALVANIPVTNGAVQQWIDKHIMSLPDYECMSEIYWTSPATKDGVPDFCLISTNSQVGLNIMSGTSAAGKGMIHKTYPNLACTFGWNFFEFAGKKYMVFVDVYDKVRPSVKMIEGDYTTLEGLQAALDAYSEETIIFSAPLQDALDTSIVGFKEGISIGDCCVREINGDIYMVAGVNCVGLSMFKLNPDFF